MTPAGCRWRGLSIDWTLQQVSGFANPKRNQTGMWPAHLAIAVLATLIAAGNHADAADPSGRRRS